MKTIPSTLSADIHLLITTLRARIEEDDVSVKDSDLHQRGVVVLSRLIAPVSPTHGTMDPARVADRLGGDLSLAVVVEQATSGLGPYFRLVAASKSVACPRCLHPISVACEGRGVCNERTWAHAAQRRRVKHRLSQADISDIHRGLQANDERAVDLAIRHGLVRLERVPGSNTEVQWVDAV